MSYYDDPAVIEGTYTMVGNQLVLTFDDDGESSTLFFTMTPNGQVFIGNTGVTEFDGDFEVFGAYMHIGVQADGCN